jgi:histidinol dehydrogenase
MIRKYVRTPADLLCARWPNIFDESQLLDYVKPIVERVRAEGDSAIIFYTEKFDGVRIDPNELEIRPDEIEEAYSAVTEEQIAALRESKRRLEVVECARLKGLNFAVELDGVEVRSTVRPLFRVGCYVPGGRAAYPSSLVMSVTPAKVAGVNEIIVCTPPDKDKRVNPLTLVAADICGVDRIFRVGGAQAVAAMAYGTGTVPRVDKIVGPGNRYVTVAKIIVSDTVAIDKPAGPSEVLVLADDTADPRLIALDMISQAEHGSGGLVGLTTTSLSVAENVERLLYELIDEVPRGDVVKDVLGSGGFIYVVDSLDQAVEFVNAFAPEHLEIMTQEPCKVAEMISSAGLILLGPYTPAASTDYCMGANHILPTGGYAKVSSGLTVLDYLKPVTFVESTRDGLEKVRKHIKALSEAEGLPNHRLAVEGRFKA